MGVRITDTTNVALYDSVSMTAFGPIFEDEKCAEDFLLWNDELLLWNDERDSTDFDGTDLRAFNVRWLGLLFNAWHDEAYDDQSRFLGTGERRVEL